MFESVGESDRMKLKKNALPTEFVFTPKKFIRPPPRPQPSVQYPPTKPVENSEVNKDGLDQLLVVVLSEHSYSRRMLRNVEDQSGNQNDIAENSKNIRDQSDEDGIERNSENVEDQRSNQDITEEQSENVKDQSDNHRNIGRNSKNFKDQSDNKEGIEGNSENFKYLADNKDSTEEHSDSNNRVKTSPVYDVISQERKPLTEIENIEPNHGQKCEYFDCRLKVNSLRSMVSILMKENVKLKSKLKARMQLSLKLKRENDVLRSKVPSPKKIGKKFTNKSLLKGIRLRLSCGSTGYENLLKQGIKLPSARTLQRRTEHLKFESGILTEVLEMLKIKTANFKEDEQKCFSA